MFFSNTLLNHLNLNIDRNLMNNDISNNFDPIDKLIDRYAPHPSILKSMKSLKITVKTHLF